MLNEQHQKLLEQARERYKITASPTRSTVGRVIGIGFGAKLTRDKEDPKNPECIRFFVEKKIRPIEAVEEGYRIEQEFSGASTDVIETGRLVAFEAQFQAQPGCSVGLDPRGLPPNVDPARTGTLGAIFQIRDDYYALVSNHAMAANGRAKDRRILLRPPNRFVDNPSDVVFATIKNHVQLEQPGPNRVDCALAEIPKEYLDRVRAEFPNLIVNSEEIIDPAFDMEVVRVDETEKAEGKIVGVNGPPRFDFSFGSFEFEDLVVIEGKNNQPFAKPGDSGALVAGKVNGQNKATAMIIGGSRKLQSDGSYKFYTFACSLPKCLAELAERMSPVSELALETLPGIKLVLSLPSRRPAKPAQVPAGSIEEAKKPTYGSLADAQAEA